MRKKLAVAVFVCAALLFASPVLAVRPSCDPLVPTTDPVALSDHWRAGIAEFVANHPDLSPGQWELLAEGADLGVPASFDAGEGGAGWFAGQGARLKRWVEQVERTFDPNQRGEILAGMGPTQLFLAASKITPIPVCNCEPIGSSCFGGGTCQAVQCATWVDQFGIHIIGLCVIGSGGPGEEPIDD